MYNTMALSVLKKTSTESPKAPSKDRGVINGGDDEEMDVLQKPEVWRSQCLDTQKMTSMAILHRGGRSDLVGNGFYMEGKKECVSDVLAEGGAEPGARDLECKSEVVRLCVGKRSSSTRLLDTSCLFVRRALVPETSSDIISTKEI